MNIMNWIVAEFSDVRMPPHYILETMKNNIPEFRQFNRETQVRTINSRSLRFLSTSDTVRIQIDIRELKPITGWNWQGLKALGWRIWKAIIDEAPTEKGYRVQWVKRDARKWRERELEAKPYGIHLDGWSWRIYACYDGEQDVLFVLDVFKEQLPYYHDWNRHA